MRVDIRAESAARLDSYASVAIAFEVAEVFDVSDQPSDSGGFSLTRRTLDVPYVKDYDVIDGGPMCWAQRFDLSRWGLLAAYAGRRRVGGAAVLVDAPEVFMPAARRELAVLWDIRVAPEARGDGIGSALVVAAQTWAAARGCRQLAVETQNVNVPACMFYLRQGFELRSVERFAYPALPDEVRLLWYKVLGGGS